MGGSLFKMSTKEEESSKTSSSAVALKKAEVILDTAEVKESGQISIPSEEEDKEDSLDAVSSEEPLSSLIEKENATEDTKTKKKRRGSLFELQEELSSMAPSLFEINKIAQEDKETEEKPKE